MRPCAAQRSSNEGEAHCLRADAGERTVEDAHYETNDRDGEAGREETELRQANDRRERRRDEGEHEPPHRPPGGSREQASRKRSNEEEQDRQRRGRRRPELALGGLVASLGRIAAHERDEDAISDDAVSVDEARDRGEKRCQPRLAADGRGQRARLIIGDEGSGAGGAGSRGGLQDFVGHRRPSSSPQPWRACADRRHTSGRGRDYRRPARRRRAGPAAAPEARRPALPYIRPQPCSPGMLSASVVANVVPENSGNQSIDGARAPAAAPRPQLIYDGDCGFCGYWARHWEKLTGDRVEYRPYQQVAAQHPAIPEADFRRAVQYVARDGRRASAAEASFLTLSHAPGKGFWLALYRYLPGFAPVSERAYAFIAAHRPAFHRASLMLWGRNHEPPRYELISFLFLRLFGLIALSAFVSFAVQAQGLIGSRGILPLAGLVDALTRLGPQRFALAPMVFWLNDSDFAIQAVCWAGAGLSLMLVLNLLPRLSLVLIYALYLSLLYAGQNFMNFQWDTFLLETAVVALVMSFKPTTGVWLSRWLLFRFMFMSGVVKLLSGDPNWWNLSALSYHFLTQPLPTPLAWYAARLPPGVLRVATGGTFLVELILPFLIFCPRRLRFSAAFGTLLLQSCILITGNYNWFNLQAMLLCLLLFDDAALEKCLPQRLARALLRRGRQRSSKAKSVVVGAWGLVLVFLSLVEMDMRFGGSPPTAL